LDGWYNLVDIVADDAKPNVLRVLFDDASKCGLGSGSHHIRLVQYDEFEPFGEKGARLCELLYLLTDDVDASVVRGVQLIKFSAQIKSPEEGRVPPREFVCEMWDHIFALLRQ